MKGYSMTRLLIAAAVAAAVIAPISANAGKSHHSKQRVHQSYHHGQMWNSPVAMHRRHIGPPWRGPNQCFEDLGYGRYESCDQ
jgi:hypothetical protein